SPAADSKGGMEAAGTPASWAGRDLRTRSCRARRLLPGLWPLGGGGAQAEGDAAAAENTGRLRAAIALAGDLQQERGADAQVRFGAWPVARLPRSGDDATARPQAVGVPQQ